MAAVHLVLQIALFGKLLYNMGTEGSCLPRSATSVMDELHDLYNTCGLILNFCIRKTLEMFAMRVGTNPPVIDVAQYFSIDRGMVATVNNFSKITKLFILFKHFVYFVLFSLSF